MQRSVVECSLCACVCVCVYVQGGSNMTGTDLCVNKLHLVPVIFEPPCILRFTAKKACTACLRTSYKIGLLTNFNKYLYIGKNEIKVNINNSTEKFKKKNTVTSLYT